ncbi:hypothetical protein C806_01820 [Lachnospiraceae bacterium 3-1]|nr:hypothetical protein C806_01820 [Lachnospiraceae bacterium 3-1]
MFNFRKVFRKVFRKISSEEYLDNLRKGGGKIGYKVQVYDTENVMIDNTRPWLLSIGEYTKITRGCVILTHDYSLSVLRRVYGEWLGEGKVTRIGKNCFLGMNTVILMGASIGDNCIVGAGSVVSGVFPDNVVIAGNPARIVRTLEQQYEKRKQQTVLEAKECAIRYKEVFGRSPLPKDLSGFKWLFTPRNKAKLIEYEVDNFSCTGDEPDDVEKAFYQTEPIYGSFKEFLIDAGIEE